LTYQKDVVIKGLTEAVRKCLKEHGKKMSSPELRKCLKENPSLEISKRTKDPRRRSDWKTSVRRTLHTLVVSEEIIKLGDGIYKWNKDPVHKK